MRPPCIYDLATNNLFRFTRFYEVIVLSYVQLSFAISIALKICVASCIYLNEVFSRYQRFTPFMIGILGDLPI